MKTRVLLARVSQGAVKASCSGLAGPCLEQRFLAALAMQ